MRSVLVGVLLLAACNDQPPPAPDYYDRVIQPILTASCIRNQGGCHKDDGTGSAFGNLDLSSYENTTRRQDVVRTYGSFPEPLLLIKAAGPGSVIPYKPGRGDGKTAYLDTQVQHAGGAMIARNSEAFYVLLQWLANGATRDGAVANKPPNTDNANVKCTADWKAARPDLAARFDVTKVMAGDLLFAKFTSDVEPFLAKNCAVGSCHSAPQSDFFLACDDNGGDGTKFNFLEVKDFVSFDATSMTAEGSEFLLRPLAPSSGGLSHTGGVFFQSKTDPDYVKIRDWANAVGASMPMADTRTPGRKFFDENVMPVLLQRGCALEACHSPGAANDFKLRPGSQGFFSTSALSRNYEEARRLFLDVDVPDVRASRIVKKPLVKMSEGGIGLPHRGGPVLQSPTCGGANTTQCDPPGLDPTMCPPFDAAKSSPFCTLVEWHRLERIDAGAAVDALDKGATFPIVYVSRAADAHRWNEFDAYAGGADLMVVDATVGALGAVDAVGAPRSLLASCPPGDKDVRHPDVDFDGSRVVFAMRIGAGDAFDVYTVKLDGTGCTNVTNGDGAGKKSANGLPIHNLDPIFAPTTPSSIVFASTRGGKGGPSLSQKYLLVQTDLWKLPANANGFDPPVQLTAGLGSELGPSLMMNGQIAMSAEKASADFYQVSGRRINWDGTDYHPLLAQRRVSKGYDPTTLAQPGMTFDQLPEHPSVGFQRATEIREGIDRNFVFIASDDGAPGMGGALVTFNRSIGPFEADRTNVGFLPSLTVIDDGKCGGAHPTGGFRSPVQLPDGRYLAAYSPDVPGGQYDLVVVDPAKGGCGSVLVNCGGGKACVQPALGYKRERKPLFDNVAQLVFGGRVDTVDAMSATGSVTYPDLPMLATLLGANLRTGRFVDAFRGRAKQVMVYQDLAPSGAGCAKTGKEMVCVSRMPLPGMPVKLNDDDSVRIDRVPSLTPLVVELQDGAGAPLFTMSEEDQLGPGEHISRGVPEPFFNSVCGGCHGSVSGRELDVAIDPDALTGASRSKAHE